MCDSHETAIREDAMGSRLPSVIIVVDNALHKIKFCLKHFDSINFAGSQESGCCLNWRFILYFSMYWFITFTFLECWTGHCSSRTKICLLCLLTIMLVDRIEHIKCLAMWRHFDLVFGQKEQSSTCSDTITTESVASKNYTDKEF